MDIFLGLPWVAWGIISGITIPFLIRSFNNRKEKKENTAVIHLSPHTCPDGIEAGDTLGIDAFYTGGKLPITLTNPCILFRKNGAHSFGLHPNDQVILSPDKKPMNTYRLGPNPFPGDQMYAVSMQDLSGKEYYSSTYPKSERLSRYNKVKWFFKKLLK